MLTASLSVPPPPTHTRAPHTNACMCGLPMQPAYEHTHTHACRLLVFSCAVLQDADAEIVVVTSATQYCSSRLAMRSKVYSVLGSVRWGCSYGPCVVPPAMSPTGVCRVGCGVCVGGGEARDGGVG